MQPLELIEHDRLGRIVDLECVIATAARRAGLDRPLGRGRAIREHRRDRLGGATAQAQPIRSCHRFSVDHHQPMLSDHVPESAQAPTVLDPATLVSHSGSPLLVLGSAGSGKTQLAPRSLPVAGGAGHAAGTHRSALPSAARADAARAGAGGGAARRLQRAARRHPGAARRRRAAPLGRLARPARCDAQRRRPPGDAGRADRRAAAPASRLRRQRRCAARQLRAPYRPAQGGADRAPASSPPGPSSRTSPREREFAAIFEAHNRMVRDLGACDEGDLVRLAIRLVEDHPVQPPAVPARPDRRRAGARPGPGDARARRGRRRADRRRRPARRAAALPRCRCGTAGLRSRRRARGSCGC